MKRVIKAKKPAIKASELVDAIIGSDLVDFNKDKSGELSLAEKRQIRKAVAGIFESYEKTPELNASVIDELRGFSDRFKDLKTIRQRIIIEQIHDALANYIEKTDDFKTYLEKTYDDYPNLLDAEFNNELLSRPEYGSRKIPLQTGSKGTTVRSKTAAQKFVKSFISPHTPYNGVLLWHGVGTGKTRAAISIAENFVGYQGGKQVIILLPSGTLEGNWRDEIFNIEKFIESKGKEVGFGKRYAAELKASLPAGASEDKIRRIANQVINKHFNIFGYQEFANKIRNELQLAIKYSSNQESARIDFIKTHFSNRVIIMDEVHVTREGGNTNDKASRTYLELIARYAQNTKMILLSATPMYNTTDEIVWLLNLLLWNDKRAPLNKEELFKEDGVTIVEENRQVLIDRCRGYISYLRGESPFTFPIKLEPTDENAISEFDAKYKVLSGGKTRIKTNIEGLTFYKAAMSEFQFETLQRVYISEASSELDEQENADIDDADEDVRMKSSFSAKISQASDIAFPGRDGEGYIGEVGLRECFSLDDGKYALKEHVRDWRESGLPFIHRANLAEFSQKFANIINCIEKNRAGISFIYSQFIDSGVNILSLILEANGFVKYEGDGKESRLLGNFRADPNDRFCAIHKKHYGELTAEERRKFKQARFVVLDGTMNKDKLTRLVREVRGEAEGKPNTNGEHILIVLGTRVVEQGVSFKCVRDTHIMEPWFHLNSLEQAAGRSIRNFSHMALKEEERNVTLYLHVSVPPDGTRIDLERDNPYNLETSDERIYRIAFEKKQKMAAIERDIKKQAIDCGLNANSNYFTRDQYKGAEKPLEGRHIINSRGEYVNRKPDGDEASVAPVKTNLYDRDNSLLCDLDKCEYKCEPPVKDLDFDKIETGLQDVNLFFLEDDIETIKDYISYIIATEFMFVLDPVILLKSLKDRKVELIGNDATVLSNIRNALEDMETTKETVVDKYGRPGVLQRVEVNDRIAWVFHPEKNQEIELDMTGRIIPNPVQINQERIDAPDYIEPERPAKQEPKSDIMESIRRKWESIKTISDFNSRYSATSQPTLQEMHKAALFNYLDKLSYANRRNLIETVILRIADRSELAELIREYLGETPSGQPIRWFNLLKEDGKIVGYRIVNEKSIVETYVFSEGDGEFELVRNLDRFQAKNVEYLELIDMTFNKQKVFGYYYDKKPGEFKFYTAAREGDLVMKKGDKIHKRALIKGANCGDSKLNKTFFKDDLIDIVGKETAINRENYNASNKERLCDEISLLWRIKDMKQGRLQSRFFYGAEEARLYYKHLESIK